MGFSLVLSRILLTLAPTFKNKFTTYLKYLALNKEAVQT